MIMKKSKNISKAKLSGLSDHKLSDTVYLVLDLRDSIRIRYVGVVCKTPFGQGYMLCPLSGVDYLLIQNGELRNRSEQPREQLNGCKNGRTLGIQITYQPLDGNR